MTNTIYKYIYSKGNISITEFNIFKFDDSSNADLHLYTTYYPNMENDIWCDILTLDKYVELIKVAPNFMKLYPQNYKGTITVYTASKLDIDSIENVGIKEFLYAMEKYYDANIHKSFLREWLKLKDNSQKYVLYLYTLTTRFKNNIFELLDFTKETCDIKYENMKYAYIKSRTDTIRLEEVCKLADPNNYFYAYEINNLCFGKILYQGLINNSVRNKDPKYETIDCLRTFKFYSKESINLNIFKSSIIKDINKESILTAIDDLEENIRKTDLQIKELVRSMANDKNKQLELKGNMISMFIE